MILQFDKFTLNTATFELAEDGEVRPVEPLVFDLLALFASNPDRVFSRDELIDAVWEGRSVSDATVSTCVKNVRKALGDSGDNQSFIRTVRGRGFRFATAVTGTTPTPQPAATSVETVADPSLLIAPFRSLAQSPELQRVAGAFPRSLSTILTRIPLLRLSAPDSLPEETTEEQTGSHDVHAEFGVDFVVEGSIQDVDSGLGVNVQLADARSGFGLWAESFPLEEDSIDTCVASIVGKLEPQLHRAMYQNVRSTDGTPNARQLFLEASGLLVMQGWHHESFPEASTLLRRSAELDPRLALAPALLSLLTGFGARLGLASDHAAATDEVVRSAELALRTDGMDSTVLGFAGCSLADVGFVERGESLLRNAIELNPWNGQALAALGAVHMTRNEVTEAVECLSRGIEISPVDSRLSVWGALLAMALLLSGDAKAASAAAVAACDRNDRTYLPRLALAGTRLVEGDERASLAALVEARRAKPNLVPAQVDALLGPKLGGRLLSLETRAAG